MSALNPEALNDDVAGRGICSSCNGSGMGATEHIICNECYGCGEVVEYFEEREYPEPDEYAPEPVSDGPL